MVSKKDKRDEAAEVAAGQEVSAEQEAHTEPAAPEAAAPAVADEAATGTDGSDDVLTEDADAEDRAADDQPVADAADEPTEASGNQEDDIVVSLLELGQGEREYTLPAGSTVSALLELARLTAKRGSVIVGTKEAGLDTVLTQGVTVVFATKVKGGCR